MSGKISTTLFNVASTGTGADIFADDIEPKLAAACAIDITLGGAAVLSVAETSGGVTVVHDLNAGAALAADQAHSLMGPQLVPGRAYNLRTSADVAAKSITVSQIRGGVL